MSRGAGCTVLAFAGSLRKQSLNKVLIEAARQLAPPGMTIESFDLRPIPLYDNDVYEAGFPTAVAGFRSALARADGVLIATPEYNFSIPGVLKNAIDWASRAPDQPFDGKPVAIMGTSPGGLGTARAQYHLRQCFVFLNAAVINRPEVMIPGARTAFDEAGRLTDTERRERLVGLLSALETAIARQRLLAGAG